MRKKFLLRRKVIIFQMDIIYTESNQKRIFGRVVLTLMRGLNIDKIFHNLTNNIYISNSIVEIYE